MNYLSTKDRQKGMLCKQEWTNTNQDSREKSSAPTSNSFNFSNYNDHVNLNTIETMKSNHPYGWLLQKRIQLNIFCTNYKISKYNSTTSAQCGLTSPSRWKRQSNSLIICLHKLTKNISNSIRHKLWRTKSEAVQQWHHSYQYDKPIINDILKTALHKPTGKRSTHTE